MRKEDSRKSYAMEEKDRPTTREWAVFRFLRKRQETQRGIASDRGAEYNNLGAAAWHVTLTSSPFPSPANGHVQHVPTLHCTARQGRNDNVSD